MFNICILLSMALIATRSRFLNKESYTKTKQCNDNRQKAYKASDYDHAATRTAKDHDLEDHFIFTGQEKLALATAKAVCVATDGGHGKDKGLKGKVRLYFISVLFKTGTAVVFAGVGVGWNRMRWTILLQV